MEKYKLNSTRGSCGRLGMEIEGPVEAVLLVKPDGKRFIRPFVNCGTGPAEHVGFGLSCLPRKASTRRFRGRVYRHHGGCRGTAVGNPIAGGASRACSSPGHGRVLILLPDLPWLPGFGRVPRKHTASGICTNRLISATAPGAVTPEIRQAPAFPSASSRICSRTSVGKEMGSRP